MALSQLAEFVMLSTPEPSLFQDIGTPTIPGDTHPFWLFEWDLIFHQEVLVCSVALFFSAVLCSAAGIGGGGIYVAVLMVNGGLTPHNAVPLSKAIVFFGSLSSLAVNMYHTIRWSGNPSGGKNVIDTDACRLVVPATLIGTFLGVLLNRHTSDYIIVILLTAVLGLMTGMVARQARNQAMEERLADEIPALPAGGTGAGTQANGGQANEGTPLMQDHRGGAPAAPAAPAAVVESNYSVTIPVSRKQHPSKTDAWMGGTLLSTVIVGGVLRFHMHACRAEVLGDTTKVGACQHPVNGIFGQSHMENWMKDTKTANIMQQMVWSVPIWCCIAITVHFGFVANRDVGWRPRTVITYQITSIITGLLAGLVGVGGGLILSPFFLLTGMEPAVAVGTSATCVLFTSSSTTMQYIFTDRIIMSLAVMYGMVCLVASFVGTALVHHIQDKFARKSYITTIVAVGVAISAMLSVVKFVYLIANVSKGAEVQAHL
jgi:uncharacterized membrane protein YfcA